MKDAIVFTLLLIFALSFESAYAETYRVRCLWDAVPTTPTYEAMYGYEVSVDGAVQVTNMNLTVDTAGSTVTCDETVTGPLGALIEGRVVNINNAIPAVPVVGNWYALTAQLIDPVPDVTSAVMLTVQSP